MEEEQNITTAVVQATITTDEVEENKCMGQDEEGTTIEVRNSLPPDTNTAEEKEESMKSTIGIARDGIAVGSTAVSGGFAAAHAGVNLGFGIAKFATRASFQAASFFMPRLEVAGDCVDTVLDAAHTITTESLHASKYVTQTSLSASDAILSLSGVARGESYRRLLDYTVVDDQMKQALLGLIDLLFEVGGTFVNNSLTPSKFVANAMALATFHDQKRKERISTRQQIIMDPTNSTENRNTPLAGSQQVDKSQFAALARHMSYAAAVYGAKSAAVLGMSANNAEAPSVLSSDDDIIRMLTDLDPTNDVLVSFRGSEMYRPGHFVAINHKDKEVVVAIRGTLSMHDVLVDLVCHTAEFNLAGNDNMENTSSDINASVMEGRVHTGFLKSAQRLANDLYSVVMDALECNPNYKLVIVGHSLGGGVATLLTLLWLRLPMFSGGKFNIHAYAFAAPCCVSSSISQTSIMRQHVTSVVFGDDIVSRLSLTTLRELQNDLINLGDDGVESVPQQPMSETNNNDNLSNAGDEKLFCGGKVFWLESREYPEVPVVEINPMEELNKIELFPEMFSIHMPNACLDNLEKLAK